MWFWCWFGNNNGILGGWVIGIVLGMLGFMMRHPVTFRHVEHFYVCAKLLYQLSWKGFVSMVGNWRLRVVIFFRWWRWGWRWFRSWWVVVHNMMGRRMRTFNLNIMNWLWGWVIRSRGWRGMIMLCVTRFRMCWHG